MTEDLPLTSTDAPSSAEISVDTNNTGNTQSDPELGASFSLDVVHEKDAAYLRLSICLPRNGALRWLVDALTSEDKGLNRMGGHDGVHKVD